MDDFSTLRDSLYAATNQGLDIIFGELPQTAVCRNNPKKKFKLRDESDASACLRPPTATRNYWCVCDYGGGEGERFFSPIDIVMRERGLDFLTALKTLAAEWNVDVQLSKSVNKPIITQRPATSDEQDGQEKVVMREGFTSEGLAVWGHGVSAEVLEKLGWCEVERLIKTKGRTTTIIDRTSSYPIFCQRCWCQDGKRTRSYFDKIYEPLNPDKQYRFHYVGKKPKDYVFGFDALVAEYQSNGSKKLSCVFLVSGGSDAVACWSRGIPAIYMGSERDLFTEKLYQRVMIYCNELYNVPDIDATGIDEGKKKALSLMDMKTIWLKPEEMSNVPDKRGNKRKDLKDYLELHTDKDVMAKLKVRGVCARFWDEKKAKGTRELVISPTKLNYYLWLQGFCTLRDDKNKAPVFLKLDGIKVKMVVAKTIDNYLHDHAERMGWPLQLRDKLRRCHDLPTDKKSTLPQLDELNILPATESMQPMYLQNCWLKVTKDSVERHSYTELSDIHVWEKRIIPHNYREYPQMFRITQDDKGIYSVDFPNGIPSKLMQVVVNTSRLYWRKQDELKQPLSKAEKAEEARCLVSRIANIGYMLHQYKVQSAAYATVCIDAKMGKDKSSKNGRSGKSVYLKAIGNIVNMQYREAKRRQDYENRFFFEGITEENGLFIIDECYDNFDIGTLFGRITGPFLVEPKGLPIYSIPFERSPKIALGTNSVIKQHDQSTEARMWKQVFSDFYHQKTEENDYLENRSVRSDIGCELMSIGYSEEDWQLDIAFLLQCLQFYLSLPQNERKIEPPMTQIRQRELQATISRSVAEWADDYFSRSENNLNRTMACDVVYNDYIKDTKSHMAPRTFTLQLKDYCKMNGLVYNPASITHKDKDGEPWTTRIEGFPNSKRCIFIQSHVPTSIDDNPADNLPPLDLGLFEPPTIEPKPENESLSQQMEDEPPF